MVRPTLLFSAGYFGLLFFVCRWWRMTDFTRRHRLSLWPVAGCLVWAWALHLFWWYPQPAGMATAATMAFAVQTSSRWLPTRRRAELARGEQGLV